MQTYKMVCDIPLPLEVGLLWWPNVEHHQPLHIISSSIANQTFYLLLFFPIEFVSPPNDSSSQLFLHI